MDYAADVIPLAEAGGVGRAQLKRLKELEKKNQHLRCAVSDVTLEKLILTEEIIELARKYALTDLFILCGLPEFIRSESVLCAE